MKTILKLAVRLMTARKSRTILSIAGVSIGFSLLIAATVLMATLEHANTSIVKEKYGDYDLVVGYQSAESFITPHIVHKIQHLDDVEKTTPFLYPYIGKEHSFQDEMALQPMYIGVKDEQLAREHQLTKLSSGRLPKRGEVVIPYSLSKAKKLHIGSKLQFPFPPQRPQEVRVSGILKKHQALQSIVLFDFKWLGDATGQINHTTTLLIKLTDAKQKQHIIKQLKEIDSDFYIDPQSMKDKEQDQMGGLKPVVSGLGVVIVFGSMLLFLSTLQMSIQERKREFSVLRLIGAQKKQLIWIILYQSVIMNVISGMIGLLGGMVLSIVLKSTVAQISGIMIQQLAVHWGAVFGNTLLAIALTIMVSVLPAVGAGNQSPLQAYRASYDIRKQRLLSVITSGVALALSLSITFCNYVYIHSPKLYLLAAGLLILAVLLGLSLFIRNTILVLMNVFSALFSSYGKLIGRNAVRQLRRSTQIVGIVLLGIMVCIVGTGILTVVKNGTEKSIQDQYPLSHVISSNSAYDERGLSPEFYDRIDSIPHVEAVPVFKSIAVYTQGLDMNGVKKDDKLMTYTINGRQEVMLGVEGVDFQRMSQSLPLHIVEGTTDLNGNHVVITQYTAKLLGYKIGSMINVIEDTAVSFTKNEMTVNEKQKMKKSARFKVVGIIKTLPLSDPEDMGVYVSPSFMKKRFSVDTLDEVHYKVTSKAFEDEVEKKVQDATANEPSSKIILFNLEEELNQLSRQFNQRFSILIVTVSLICFLSFIGLMNSMASSLRERVSEFATLRALGTNARRIVQITVAEGMVLTFTGGLLGAVFGTIILNQLLLALDYPKLIISWPFVSLALLVSPVIGFFATLAPALSLRKRPILQDLSKE